ncbi:MAG: hypothetical protein IPP72_00105 [Chitinophagaceae bacterium]|nr:hypothetical protein [Chitinophagaceae bacterium]
MDALNKLLIPQHMGGIITACLLLVVLVELPCKVHAGNADIVTQLLNYVTSFTH